MISKHVYFSVIGLFYLSISHSAIAKDKKTLDITAYAQLASDYVYRGISYADGKLSPSIALSANHNSGLYATFWAGRDDIAGVLGNPQRRDIETEYSLGYQRVINRNWSASVKHTWHEYLRRYQPRNHDYQETQLQVHYRDFLSASIGYAENIWTTGRDAVHMSVSYRHSATLPVFETVFLEHEIGVTSIWSH